eukprot:1488416-Karenia_brevis.AAC.1
MRLLLLLCAHLVGLATTGRFSTLPFDAIAEWAIVRSQEISVKSVITDPCHSQTTITNALDTMAEVPR